MSGALRIFACLQPFDAAGDVLPVAGTGFVSGKGKCIDLFGGVVRGLLAVSGQNVVGASPELPVA